MKGDSGIISDSMVDIVPPLATSLMLALAFFTLTYNQLFDTLTELLHVGMPVSGTYASLAIAIILIPLALLRIWNNSLLKIIVFASWALYLPSILYFSGIDPFKILDLPMDFSVFSSQLSPVIVTVVGIVLAAGSLLVRSFADIKIARDNFLGRGADKKEVYPVLKRNAVFETRIILASAAAVLLIMAGVPLIEGQLLDVLMASGFVYILAGLGAIAVLAILFLVYLWPRKKSEKG